MTYGPSPVRKDGERAALLARLVVLLALILIPATARAGQAQGVASDVYVERQDVRADGSRRVRLQPAALVRSGDNLVFRVNYHPGGAASPKLLTSVVPDSVDFISGGDIVSVDGGRHWGPLVNLAVRDADGTLRRALAEDVTHVRWLIGEPGEPRSSLLFRGRAR